MRTSQASLFSDLDVDVTPDAPLGAMTWYGIGGRADLLLRPHTVDALATLAHRCHRAGVPLRILGRGANVLVADEGVDGIVVRLDVPAFREVRYEPSGDVVLLRAMAGADLARTLMDAVRRGLAGLDPLAGIPASIGGAVRMNAGGRYGSTGDVVESVACLTAGGERRDFAARDVTFGYRETSLAAPHIVAATFRLEPTDPIRLRERVKEIFEYKKSTQPLADHSAGCSFKNPIDPVTEKRVSAGRLIDDAGLKEETIGGASVSRAHANFIVVEAGATATDVLALMDVIRRRVFDHAGLRLEDEVVVWRRSDAEDGEDAT